MSKSVEEIIEKLRNDADYAKYSGFDVVFSMSVSDAKELIRYFDDMKSFRKDFFR